MRAYHLNFSMAVLDRNGVSVAQKPTAASNLTITGALATGGVATFDVARHVGIYSSGADTGRTFTVTGTDRNGKALSEAITGPGAAATVNGSSNFLTITQIAVDAATAGNIEVGTTDEADTAFVVTDAYRDTITYGIDLSASAGLTSEFKYTVSDPFDSSFSQETANYRADLGASNGDYQGVSDGPISGCRLEITNWTSADDIVNFHIITSDK